MTDPTQDTDGRRRDASRETSPGKTPAQSGRIRKKSKSMHDGIAVWCDCCSCEAEPYWVEIAKEMGVDLGSDYED